VVNATTSTITAATTSTYVDTTLAATITPKFANSKILVTLSANGSFKGTNNTAILLRLQRNASTVTKIEGLGAYTGATDSIAVGSISMTYLDSPATTSATTYTVQIASANNSATVKINEYFSALGDSVSSITLMEIAG
jgi:hypothetical protein